ncbi:unnamed protein product, partial [Closterium sp. NIES-54]
MALCSQRPISEVVAASSQAMVTPLRLGARGPSVTRSAGTGAHTSRTLPRIPGAVDAAMAACASQQERHILELQQTIARLESRGGRATSPAVVRLITRQTRAREPVRDVRVAIRLRVNKAGDYAEGPPTVARSPMVEAALKHEVRNANTDGEGTPGLDFWADRLEDGNKLIPDLENGFKVFCRY